MVTITISGAEKSGALARIAAFLVRKGYPLKGQQIAESASGARLVKISLEVSHLDKAKLAAEMRSLSPDFKVVSVEGAQTARLRSRTWPINFPTSLLWCERTANRSDRNPATGNCSRRGKNRRFPVRKGMVIRQSAQDACRVAANPGSRSADARQGGRKRHRRRAVR